MFWNAHCYILVFLQKRFYLMKNYFSAFLIVLALGFGVSSYAQSDPIKSSSTGGIAELSIYPNPVSNGKIYITSKDNLTKQIEIYDVLGKKVLSTLLFSKEVNIVKLTPGIYVVKIKEGNNSATRKLVVR